METIDAIGRIVNTIVLSILLSSYLLRGSFTK
jgi:hypothetical protein